MKSIYLSQINNYVASMIEDEFYVLSLSKSTTTDSGIPYCTLTLADKTGSINARVWDQHMQQISENILHTVVRVQAEVFANNDGSVELVISRINETECHHMEDFINTLDEQLKNKYYDALQKMGEQVSNSAYKQLLSNLIDKNECYIKDSPLSIHEPGNYNGAVLVQIVSVTSIAIQIYRSHKSLSYPFNCKGIDINADLIIIGSILATIGDINHYSAFPCSTPNESALLITNELQSIQLLEECLKEEPIILSSVEKNHLYNIIHTVLNKATIPTLREAAIIRSAYEIFKTLISMDSKYYKTQKYIAPDLK